MEQSLETVIANSLIASDAEAAEVTQVYRDGIAALRKKIQGHQAGQ